MGTEFFHVDRQTDMTKLVVAFRNFGTRLKILGSAHTMYLCLLCGSENKHRLLYYN
jgi:hypothetical protein